MTSTRRTQVMKDSDYIINCIEVNGPQCVEMDNDIPLKYGVDQCIGDTIGPGGMFKGLRTIPAFLDILKRTESRNRGYGTALYLFRSQSGGPSRASL